MTLKRKFLQLASAVRIKAGLRIRIEVQGSQSMSEPMYPKILIHLTHNISTLKTIHPCHCSSERSVELQT